MNFRKAKLLLPNLWLILFFVPNEVWSQVQALKCMSFNIRYDEPRDGPDRWSERKKDLADFLLKEKPIILGIQEGLHHQVEYLDGILSRMTYVGFGRDNGKMKGEYCALFIDTLIFEILEDHTIWLSESPEKPSTGWDAALPRIATFAKLRNKANRQEYFVWNTHFDHMGKQARLSSARLISQKALEMTGNKIPTILMGDFNLQPHEEPYALLTQFFSDSRTLSNILVEGPDGTFQAFGKEPATRRIDYIFVKGLTALSHKHADERRPGGRFPSDHFPVIVSFAF